MEGWTDGWVDGHLFIYFALQTHTPPHIQTERSVSVSHGCFM